MAKYLHFQYSVTACHSIGSDVLLTQST